MRELQATRRLLAETPKGPIVLVTISGSVESRVGGIDSVVTDALSGVDAAGVAFDLSEMDYISWDDLGIQGLVRATQGLNRPCCVISHGRARLNLEVLFAVTRLSQWFGGRVFQDQQDAIDYLIGRVGDTSA